ncbi:MAG TPA: NnrU family protein [Ktedonobacterales bacterium]|nr:NnrU family protein [Ktedonobacterales bacterium]
MSVESQRAPWVASADQAPSLATRVGATLALLIGVICYVTGLAGFLYFVWFVEGVGAPKGIDAGLATPVWSAVAIDAGLLAFFAGIHSLMARPGFKAWWTRIVPHSLERSVYVAVAGLSLLLLSWQWCPLTAVIWRVDNTLAAGALLGLSVAGWLLAFVSTFLINHFDMLGLRQVYLAWRRKAYTSLPFRTPLFYKLIRHPMMLGLLIAFWAAPQMTTGHLLLALALTAYILLAVRFLEERDLVAALGEDYVAYQRATPMLVPFIRRRRS